MANLPTYYRDDAAVAARTAEVPGADWDNGCNIAGSCADGCGIGTDIPDLDQSQPNWTLLDQDGDPRTPQVGQHIGGTGLGGTLPSSGGAEGKGTTAVRVATVSTTGDGTVTSAGDATLADLSVGWTAV